MKKDTPRYRIVNFQNTWYKETILKASRKEKQTKKVVCTVSNIGMTADISAS